MSIKTNKNAIIISLSLPNFITEGDVNRFKASKFNKRKFGQKKGAVKAQGTKPTASQMLSYMNQNVNQIDDTELKTYIDLNRQGKILLIFHLCMKIQENYIVLLK